jgi:hypothetical protein
MGYFDIVPVEEVAIFGGKRAIGATVTRLCISRQPYRTA